MRFRPLCIDYHSEASYRLSEEQDQIRQHTSLLPHSIPCQDNDDFYNNGSHGNTTKLDRKQAFEELSSSSSTGESRQNDTTDNPRTDGIQSMIAARPAKEDKEQDDTDGEETSKSIYFFGPTICREDCVQREIDTVNIMNDYHDMTTEMTHKFGGIEGLLNKSINVLRQQQEGKGTSTACDTSHHCQTPTTALFDSKNGDLCDSSCSVDYLSPRSSLSQIDLEHDAWKNQIQEFALLDQSPYLRHPPEQVFNEEELFGLLSHRVGYMSHAQHGRKYVESYLGKQQAKQLGEKRTRCPTNDLGKKLDFQKPNHAISNDFFWSNNQNFDSRLRKGLETLGISKFSFNKDKQDDVNGIYQDGASPETLLFSNKSDLDVIILTITHSTQMCLDPPLPIPLREEDTNFTAPSATQPSTTQTILQKFGIPSLSREKNDDKEQARALKVDHEPIHSIPIPGIESIIRGTLHSADSQHDSDSSGERGHSCCIFTKAPLSVMEHQLQRIPHIISNFELSRSDMFTETSDEALDPDTTITPLPARLHLLDMASKRFQQNKLSDDLGLDIDDKDANQERCLMTGASIRTMKTIGQMLNIPTALYLPHVSSREEEIKHPKNVSASHPERIPPVIPVLPNELMADIRKLVASKTKKCDFVACNGKAYPIGSWDPTSSRLCSENIWIYDEFLETSVLPSIGDFYNNAHELQLAFCQKAKEKACHQSSRVALWTGCVSKRNKADCIYYGFISGEPIDARIFELRYMRLIRNDGFSKSRGLVVGYCESALTEVATAERISSRKFLLRTKKSCLEGNIPYKLKRKQNTTSFLASETCQQIRSFFDQRVPLVHKEPNKGFSVIPNFHFLFDCKEAGKIRRELVYLESTATQLSQTRYTRSVQTDHDVDDCSWIHLSRTERLVESNPTITSTSTNKTDEDAPEHDNSVASSPQVHNVPVDLRKKGKRHPEETGANVRQKKKKKRKKDKRKRKKRHSKKRSSSACSAESKRSKHAASTYEENVNTESSKSIENIELVVQAPAEESGVIPVVSKTRACTIQDGDIRIKKADAIRKPIQIKKMLASGHTDSEMDLNSTSNSLGVSWSGKNTNKVAVIDHAVKPTPVMVKKRREDTDDVPEASKNKTCTNEGIFSPWMERLAYETPQGENDIINKSRDQNIGNYLNLPTVKALCSESFLESFGNAIAELASGKWATSFAANSVEALSREDMMFKSQQEINGRRILLMDSPLLDDTGVDLELLGGTSLIVLRISSFCTRTATKNVMRLAALGRYTQLIILLCFDVDITPCICRDISILQNAIISLKGGMRTKVLYNTVSPDSLSASLAHRILKSVGPNQMQIQKHIESSILDSRILERVRFLISLCPMISVTSALWLLNAGAETNKDHRGEDVSKAPFQNLLGNQALHEEDLGVRTDLINQIVYATNVSLSNQDQPIHGHT